MALWMDKYRPHKLSELTFHQDLTSKLSEIVRAGNFPHLMFYGPDGAGKYTRIHCILRELYGAAVENVKMDERTFETPSGKKLEITTLSSNYHIEVCPSDVGFQDRVVVQEIIKQMAQSPQINTAEQKAFKVVVLTEADKLSKDAQHSLRRTMEKYAATCKIFLSCSSMSKIIEPLRSRTMVVRVSAPSDDEIRMCLKSVARKENVNVSDGFLHSVLTCANGNIRRAFVILEASSIEYGNELNDRKPIEPDWEVYIRDIAALALRSRNARGILEVRNGLYEILSRGVPTSVVFKHLLDSFLKYCTPAIRTQVIEAAARYEHSSLHGSKEIYHLEAFVVTFMDLYTNHNV